MERDLNNNEDTRQPTFWERWKKNICCFDLRNNDGSREDSGFVMIPLRDENQMGSGKLPQRRFALGPNLPSFINCLRREKAAQRYDADVRLVIRIKDYNDDSNSPLWQLREDVIKLYKLQPKYGNRQDTEEEESQKLEPVAGPSKMKRRKLASRRSRLFALKEEELKTSMDMSTVSEITSSSSDSSDDYD